MQIVKIKSKNFLVISIFLYCCQQKDSIIDDIHVIAICSY
jgi:hypothetical protein